jgi:hypothetical protein
MLLGIVAVKAFVLICRVEKTVSERNIEKESEDDHSDYK